MWIDSHTHLVSNELFKDFEENTRLLDEYKVKKVLIICGNMQEVKRAFKYLEGDRRFDFAIGVHPTSTRQVKESEFLEMMSYLDHPQVVAVGEIGLDYYWDDSYKELQKQRFKEQIDYANRHELPVIIHTRNSSSDALDFLKKNPVDEKGVIHCFSESMNEAILFQNLGFYLGYTGIITFSNAHSVREALKATSFDRLLMETDAPYLTPEPHRGKRNKPAYVAYVGQAMAEILGEDEESLKKQVEANYYRLFNRSRRV